MEVTNAQSANELINKDTVLCISVAARPSNLGTTLHNAGYRALGLNYIYKAFKVTDIRGAIEGVRALQIRGCGVSMPFKETVIDYLDALDPAAKAIGAVNTVVNQDGFLTGYNTDTVGARASLKSVHYKPGESVLVLGAGGVARAILYALKEFGETQVALSNRNFNKASRLAASFGVQAVSWEEREQARPALLINATSIGMAPEVDRIPVSAEFLNDCRAVFDVISTPLESRLVALGRAMGKAVAPGFRMSLYQAAAQIKLYCGEEPPAGVLEAALHSITWTAPVQT